MFLSQRQIDKIGFGYVGKFVRISDKAVFYNPGSIMIDDYSRIDDFAILSSGIRGMDKGINIGKYVHIGCYSSLIGQEKITMDNYSGISSRVSIYSSSDKYDGEYMTNPCIPGGRVNGQIIRNTYHEPVYLGKHVVVGAGSVILPGVNLNSGCAVGAMSLVTKEDWFSNSIIAGIPAKLIGKRKENIYELEKLI